MARRMNNRYSSRLLIWEVSDPGVRTSSLVAGAAICHGRCIAARNALSSKTAGRLLKWVHDKEVKPNQDEANPPCERVKERRNPSADAHGEPMSGG
jgi:hypothetical protein